VGAEVIQFSCSSCKSRLLARVSRGPKGVQGKQIDLKYAVKITQESPLLAIMRKQEEDEAKMTVEEKDAQLARTVDVNLTS
jgi:hypothetical protein